MATGSERKRRSRQREAERRRLEPFDPFLTDDAALALMGKLALPALATEPAVMDMPVMDLPSPEVAERLRRALTKLDIQWVRPQPRDSLGGQGESRAGGRRLAAIRACPPRPKAASGAL